MRGLISLPANIIGYIITLAIFIVGIFLIITATFQFQTIPEETPEKSTACDLGFGLSLWKDATTYPNIFDKSYLESWDREEIGASIFEKGTSKFFLPGSDFFVEIKEGNNRYKLYVPPESKTTFDTCGDTHVRPKSYSEIEKFGIEDTIGDFREREAEEEYLERATTYNEIHAVCNIEPVFVEETDKVEIGKMTVALTSNIATKIRKGIYELATSENPKDRERIYSLGAYPEGCIYDEGFYKGEKKVEEKEEAKSWWIFEGIVSAFSDFFGWLGRVFEGVLPYIPIPGIEVDCGFNWDWENQTDKFILNVTMLKPGLLWTFTPEEAECKFSTRIPKKIVEETNLVSRLCKPRNVALPVRFPEGNPFGEGKKHFFLKIEKLNYDLEDEGQAKEFCKTRCETEGPFDPLKFLIDRCEDFCNEGWGLLKECDPLGPIVFCNFARHQIYLFKNLPKDAIDIRYIVVDENKLAGRSFEELSEEDYYAYKSACSTWPGIFECTTSKDCESGVCIYKGWIDEENKLEVSCDSCIGYADKYCSPNYLEYQPDLGIPELYYTCQEVENYSAPLTSTMFAECLPKIEVKILDTNGDEISEVDCSSNPNTEIKWTINASSICCGEIDEEDLDEDRIKEECLRATNYCPRMKFWSSLDASNSFSLDENLFAEMFISTIEQQVCRGGTPYNNVERAFIVASYYVGDKEFKYVLPNSEIEIK